jgi:curved DNA-binding protein CbpA
MSNQKCFTLLELSCSVFKFCSIQSNLRNLRRISSSTTHTQQDNQEASKFDEQDQDGAEKSSSFHQNFHRRSYERKRTDYQKERKGSHGYGSRTLSFMTNPSITHYQRLNIDPSASIDTIKSAYYSLSKQYHPDIVGRDDPIAVENFRIITDAYDTLSNPDARKQYDKQIQLHSESPSEPVYTSWRPQGHSGDRQETIFRMREAHRIFQSKQDEALAREKERNPNKFRSGVFRQEINDIESDRKRLESHLRFMDETSAKISSSTFRSSDNNELYRVHLYSTLIRKQRELDEYQQERSGGGDEFLWLSLATIFGVLFVVMLTTTSSIYDFDLAAILDGKIETKIKDNTEVKR